MVADRHEPLCLWSGPFQFRKPRLCGIELLDHSRKLLPTENVVTRDGRSVKYISISDKKPWIKLAEKDYERLMRDRRLTGPVVSV